MLMDFAVGVKKRGKEFWGSIFFSLKNASSLYLKSVAESDLLGWHGYCLSEKVRFGGRGR